MSNYTPKYIDRETWQIINATIRKYPRMYVDLVDGEQDIIHGSTYKETVGSAGFISDPTAAKGIRLASRRREEMRRKCDAINYCLSHLRPEHRRVVCLRYWGVEQTGHAFELVREGEMLHGMRYESIQTPQTVGDTAGYSSKQAKRIIKAFVISVGRVLGEI